MNQACSRIIEMNTYADEFPNEKNSLKIHMCRTLFESSVDMRACEGLIISGSLVVGHNIYWAVFYTLCYSTVQVLNHTNNKQVVVRSRNPIRHSTGGCGADRQVYYDYRVIHGFCFLFKKYLCKYLY